MSGFSGDSSQTRSQCCSASSQAARVGLVETANRPSALRLALGDDAGDAVVRIARHGDVRADRQPVEDGRRRRHARGEHQRAATVEPAEQRLERIGGRRAVGPAVEPLVGQVEVRREHRRHVERLADLAVATARDQPGLRVPVRHPVTLLAALDATDPRQGSTDVESACCAPTPNGIVEAVPAACQNRDRGVIGRSGCSSPRRSATCSWNATNWSSGSSRRCGTCASSAASRGARSTCAGASPTSRRPRVPSCRSASPRSSGPARTSSGCSASGTAGCPTRSRRRSPTNSAGSRTTPGRSVTELEILHGVLNDPDAAGTHSSTCATRLGRHAAGRRAPDVRRGRPGRRRAARRAPRPAGHERRSRRGRTPTRWRSANWCWPT